MTPRSAGTATAATTTPPRTDPSHPTLYPIMLTRLVTRLVPALRGASASARVHPAADFRGYLRRECIRADRTGRELSLVVLTPSPSGTSALLDLLGRRLRETDE